MLDVPRTLFVAVNVAFAAGCCHVRNLATTDARDYGRHIETKYRYWVVDENKQFSRQFAKENPSVFSDDGIPIEIHTYQGVLPSKSLNFRVFGNRNLLWEFFYFCCQMGTGWMVLPYYIRGYENVRVYSIKIVEVDARTVQMSVFESDDKIVGGLIPIIPLLCYHGNPAPESFAQGRIFETHEYLSDCSSKIKSNFTKALVYGVASKLKEMESAGIINESVVKNAAAARRSIDKKRKRVEDEIKKRQELDRERRTYEARAKMLAIERQKREVTIGQTMQHPQSEPMPKAPYHIVMLERDERSDFSYRFALSLNGEPSIKTFFGLQKIFAEEIRVAYQSENPGSDASALRVAVQPQLVNGRIEGRAEVLTITPLSLVYDANTRHGKLSARFNAGQAEEARIWIRKNIETLARDKNIAITTGTLPPEATYYSLGERIEENVMEIEFKTE